MTQPIKIHQHPHSGLTRNGYILDARIAWWKVQTRTQAIVLTVSGELDASNSDRFDQSLRELPGGREPFVIDLRDATFVGVQCFRTLLWLDAECRATGTRWALITNPQTRTLFRIIDPENSLPATNSLSEAIASVAPARRSALQVISSRNR